jgi:uncharacterized protein (DUF2235 family)
MAKNIVVCCDGTGAEPGWLPSNVIKLFRCITRESATQRAFYDPGVGTSFRFSGPPLVRHMALGLDMAGAGTIGGSVSQAYYFIMDHYEPGDRLFLFGFSRGAFTVRALARLIHKCGLLDVGCRGLMPYAIKFYHRRRSDGIEMDFKKTYCRPCKPHFIGLWDTVAALGWSARHWRLSDFELNPDVSYAYQAIAIDEERRKFPVVLWSDEVSHPNQTAEQVWFAGAHSDIGGGYPESGLSDIPLAWMLDKGRAAGLLLNDTKGINPNASGRLHNSRIGAWRMWRPKPRRIPEGARIHSSVFERMEVGPGYRPDLPTHYTVAS